MDGLRWQYFEVEKRKNGEVSLKAATDCRARARAHNLLGAILDGVVVSSLSLVLHLDLT